MAKSSVSNYNYQVMANTIELVSQSGIFNIANSGNQGTLNLSALGSIKVNIPTVSLEALNFDSGGSFCVLAGGVGPVIQVGTSSETGSSSVVLANSGVAISYLAPDGGPASVVNLGAAQINAVVSEGGLFSKLTMLPDEVLIEVGSTILSISDEGLTITAGETVVSVTSEGINEVSGDTSRELNSEGHNFTAAETVLNVGSAGVSLEAATLNMEVDGAKEENASTATSSFDATGSVESAMTTIE
jgi:hypothetical protein